MWTHIEQSTLSGDGLTDGTFNSLDLFFAILLSMGKVPTFDFFRSIWISCGIFGKGLTFMSGDTEVLLFVVVWTTWTGFFDTEDFDSKSKLKKKSDELKSNL